MKMHGHQAAAALAGAVLIAAGASAGCTPALESAKSSPARHGEEDAARVMTEAGDDIRELTLRMDWTGLAAAPVILGVY